MSNKIPTIRISEAIREILSNDTHVTGYVGNRMYPVGINVPNQDFPYIVYTRSNILAEDSKDYNPYTNTCNVYISVFSVDYTDSLDIACAVVDALEHTSGVYAGINISDCRFQNIDEQYESDCYIQTISFNISD